MGEPDSHLIYFVNYTIALHEVKLGPRHWMALACFPSPAVNPLS